jgi:hypothetical protein
LVLDFLLFMPPPLKEGGAYRFAFVRPSVCPGQHRGVYVVGGGA